MASGEGTAVSYIYDGMHGDLSFDGQHPWVLLCTVCVYLWHLIATSDTFCCSIVLKLARAMIGLTGAVHISGKGAA